MILSVPHSIIEGIATQKELIETQRKETKEETQ
jgi:hypothetical protein